MVRDELRARIEERCLQTGGPFTLSTGLQSNYYFDCKRAVMQGPILKQIAIEMLKEADRLPEQPTAIGGLSIGADFIVAATIHLAAQQGHPMVNGCIVRKERKQHGTRNFIENELPKGTKVMVVDDVVTSGKSTALACDRIREAGSDIVGIVCLIDRGQGGSEYLSKRFGVSVRSVFKSSDFPGLAEHP